MAHQTAVIARLQSLVAAALVAATQGVEWGEITGTPSSQSDLQALFDAIPGAARAQYSITSTAATAGGAVAKMAGTTTAGLEVGLTHSDNRLTNNTGATLLLHMHATITVGLSNSDGITAYFAKNGSIISESAVRQDNGNNSDVDVALNYIVSLDDGDFVEVWLDRDNSGTYIATHGHVSAFSV